MKWVIWRKWARTTLWEWSYGRERVSLWKWLDLFVVTKSFQNEWIQWDLNELKWIEVNRVKWVNWRKWARTTLWESPYGQKKVSLWKWLEWTLWESPYELRMNVPIKVTWNNPMGKSLWSIESVPMKVTWVNPMRKSLSKWMDSMRFDWIEVNRVKWSEMSELKELT